MERGPAGVAWVAVMVPAVGVVLSCLVDDPLGLLSMTSGPPSPPTPPPPELEDVGEPLFLTPLLEAGKIEEVRRLSRVPLREEYAVSYASLFTVNKTFDSSHFVWFFPARKGWKDAPVMVWLDGGPDLSSMFGLFGMHGPFSVTVDRELVPREHTSTKHFNIAFIDNPVFSGYSNTGDEKGVPRDQTQVGSEMHSAVTQLLQMFPEIKDNKLFVVGHSYAGIAIGNGVVELESLIHYGDMLYVLGIVDEKERRFFKVQSELARTLVSRGDLVMAQKVVGSLMGTDEGRSYYGGLVRVSNIMDFVKGDVIGEVLFNVSSL